MPSLTRAYLCLSALLLFAACQPVRVTRVGSAPARPPVLTDSVRVFYSRDAVPGRYEEIALLSTNAEWLTRGHEAMYAALRKKAGEIGANAVILSPVEEPTAVAKVASILISSPATLRGSAIAIFLVPADSLKTPR